MQDVFSLNVLRRDTKRVSCICLKLPYGLKLDCGMRLNARHCTAGQYCLGADAAAGQPWWYLREQDACGLHAQEEPGHGQQLWQCLCDSEDSPVRDMLEAAGILRHVTGP